MKLLNLRKLTFLAVLLSSIAFSHNALADKDPHWGKQNIYGGGGDGAGTFQGGGDGAGDFQIEGGDQSLQDLLNGGKGKKPKDDEGKKPDDVNKSPDEVGKKPDEVGKAMEQVLKVFKMKSRKEMEEKYGKDFVFQAIHMQMMSNRMASLDLGEIGRAPSTEEEKAFLNGNRDTELTIQKVQKDIVTESDTVTNGGNK